MLGAFYSVGIKSDLSTMQKLPQTLCTDGSYIDSHG